MPGDGDLVQVGASQLVGEHVQFELTSPRGRDLADLRPADALGRQDFLGRVSLDDSRNEQARELGEPSPELRGVPRFHAIVQFIGQRTFQLAQDA